MRVYIWIPLKNINLVGHAAIQIGDEYFSFNPDKRQDAEFELWNTLEQDVKNFGKKADKIVDINVDKIFHPYILDIFNPSGTYFRGLGGWYYNLFENNCCHAVGRFMTIGILPYIVSIFGDSEQDSYWLKWDSSNRHARLEKMNSLYYKYNSYNKNALIDPLQYLFHWQEFELYKKALYHMYGPSAIESVGNNYAPPNEEFFFNPKNFLCYVLYAKAVVEDLAGKVPSIPRIYQYEYNDYGESRKKEIKEFKRQIIGFKGLILRWPRVATPSDFTKEVLERYFNDSKFGKLESEFDEEWP